MTHEHSDIDPLHIHSDEYNALWKVAREHGWVVPVNHAFPDDAWVRYWNRMAARERGEIVGRPVPPHRSA